MIGDIIFFTVIFWTACTLIVLFMITSDEDIDIDGSIVFLFPANLIFIIKYWWKTIVKSIKS